MGLSYDIISEFVKVTNGNKEKPKEGIVYATIVQASDGKYVKIDGSDLLTPTDTTTDIEDGERVTVMIKDHRATVTGNVTAPSASGNRVDKVVETVTEQIGVFETVVADKVSVNELEAYKATIENLIVGKADIEDLEATNAVIENLKVKDAEIENAIIDKADIEDLEAVNAVIENLKVKDAEIENLVADKATINDLNAVNADIQNLKAQHAHIEDLVADKADIEDLEATNAEIENLKVKDAEIENLVADKATIEDLEATKAEIEVLDADFAEIKTLVSGNLTSDNILSFNITADKVTMEDAFIKDAMIDTVNAAKINAGRINTNSVVIGSEDGGMRISGATQQFTDKNGNVRIQIGRDTSNDFTFALYGEDGQGQIINQNGITASAIADGLIVNDMVSDNAAISGGKLDISSVVTEINNDNTTTIKSNKIYLDEQNQSLEVAFKSLKTQVDTIKDIDSDLTTITDKIQSNTSKIEANKSSISTLLAEDAAIKKQVTDLEGNVVETTNTLTSKYTSLQQNLDGFKTTVNNTYATKTSVNDVKNNLSSNYSTTSAMNSAIEQKVDEISASVSSTYATKNEVKTIDDNIKANYSTTEQMTSAINVAKDAINLGISQVYESKTEVNNKVSNAINNIQIGAANLLKNTKTFSEGYSRVGTSTLTPNGYNGFTVYYNKYVGGDTFKDFSHYNAIKPEPNQTYTLSFWAKGSGTITNYFYPDTVKSGINSQGRTTTASDGHIKITLTDTWTKYWVTWTTLSDLSGVKNIILSRQHGDTDSEVYLCGVKFEKGNKATDWIPAIEDINKDIDGAETNAISESKNYTDSQIKISKDAIELGVSQTYETKSSVTSQISNTLTSAKSYADTKKSEAISTASSDATSKANNALNSAKSYADTKKSEAITSANNTLNSTIANYYTKAQTDSQIKIAKDAINLGVSETYETKTNVTSKVNSAISTASSDATSKANNALNSAKSYADTKKSEAITSANNTLNSTIANYYTKTQTDSQIKIAKDAINLGVSQTYETKTNVTSKVNSAISTASSDATTKANNALSSAKSYTDTAKNDLNTAIGKKANSADVYTKTEVYTKSQTDSAIKVAKDAIDLSVKSVDTKVTNITNTVNNIQIGTENLLQNSNFYNSLSNWTTQTYGTAGTDLSVTIVKGGDWTDSNYNHVQIRGTNHVDRYGIHSSAFKVVKGQKYTVSGYAAGHRVGKIRVTIRKSSDGVHIHNYEIPVVTGGNSIDKYKYFTTTFTAPTDTDTILFCFYGENLQDNGYVWGTLFKIEKGTKATDWTQSSKDIATDITKAKNDAITSANGTLTTTIKNYYTKTETDSQIKIAKDAINLGVSQTYETKTNVSSQINNTLSSAKSYADTKKSEAISSASSDATSKANNALNSAKSYADTKKSEAITSANNTLNSTIANYYTKTQTDSQIKIAKDAINLGVSQTYETKTNVTSKVNSAISTASSDASTKANNALSSAKSYADTKKTEAINSANTTLNNTIANYYTKTQTDSAINVAKNSITQRVEVTEKELKELTVGGVNLLSGTKDLNGWGIPSGGTTNQTQDGFKVYYNKYTYVQGQYKDFAKNSAITPKPNQTYTLSFWAKGSGTINSYFYPSTVKSGVNSQGKTTTSEDGSISTTLSSTWTKYWITWTTLSSVSGSKNVIVCRQFNSNSEVYIYGIKLEEGNKATSWSEYPETINTNITNLTTRMSAAESKITDTAITNVVKKNFYTKSETDGQITSKGYQTASQVQQTVNNLQLKFTQSGGYNLFSNSGFKKGTSYWGTHAHNSPTGGSIETLASSATWGFPDSTVNCVQIKLSNQSGKEYGITQSVKTTIGKKYTLSFYYAGHRLNQINAIVRNSSGGWLANKYVNTFPNGGNTNVGNWSKYNLTFTANATSHNINIVIVSAANDGYLWVAKPMVVEGELDLPYSPNPNEMYDGIIKMDKDGIKVSTSNGGWTDFTSAGMNVYNKSSMLSLGTRNGGLTYHNNSGYLGFTSESVINSYNVSGVTLSTANDGSYITLGTSTATDPFGGFSSTPALSVSKADLGDSNSFYKQGVNLHTSLNVNTKPINRVGRMCYGVNGVTRTYESTTGNLCLFGDNGIVMGYYEGNDLVTKFKLIEGDSKGTSYIDTYAHWRFNNWSLSDIANLSIKNNLKMETTATIQFNSTATYPSLIWEASNRLKLYGNDGIDFGYRNGSSNMPIFRLHEGADTEHRIESFSHWNFNNWNLENVGILKTQRLQLPSTYGSNWIGLGTGDGNDYTTYNVKFRTHNGLAFTDNSDSATVIVQGRQGRIMGKNAYYVNCSRSLKSDIRSVISESDVATFTIKEGETLDTNISAETVCDFLDAIDVKTYVTDFKQEGATQECFDIEKGNSLTLGYIADDVAEHPLFKYVGEKTNDGLYAINSNSLTTTLIVGYQQEKRKREQLEERLMELERLLKGDE